MKIPLNQPIGNPLYVCSLVIRKSEPDGLSRGMYANDGGAMMELCPPQAMAMLSRRNGTAMTNRIQQKDVVQLLARRMSTDEQTAEAWIDAFTETMYEAFKAGRSVTLPGFGGFYVRPQHEAWAFNFNPGQKLCALFGWSSSYKGQL